MNADNLKAIRDYSNLNKENRKERDYLEVLMDQCYCEQVAQEEYIEQINNTIRHS